MAEGMNKENRDPEKWAGDKKTYIYAITNASHAATLGRTLTGM